jgi:hypothetical protein
MALENTLNTTALCNIALAHIGQNELTDVETDSSPEATACQRYYSIARKDVLREHSWGFATVQEALTENPGVDSDDYPEWDYFYSYPSNALNVWAVFNEVTASEKWEQEFEKVYNPTLNEHIILTHQESAFAEYTYDVQDVTLWDEKFVLAFTWRLASLIAKAITGDDDVGIKALKISNDLVSDAKRVGHAEKKKKVDFSSKTINART